jgi:hypothetical protein
LTALAGDLVALVLGAAFLETDRSAFFAIWNYYLWHFEWMGFYNPGILGVKFDWLYLTGSDFMPRPTPTPLPFPKNPPC